ncbi:MAG: hypothetical protein HY550_04335 [Elusimicrobia bacterium]|nr:hypothetical protein [Elusimicrobiota bacterium]
MEEERVGSALKIVISAEPSTGAASLPPLPPPEETRVALRAAPGSEAWLASASRALGEALRESGFSIVEGRSEAQFIASLDVRLAHVKDPRLGSLSAYEAHVLVRLSEPLRDEIVAEPSARASYADWDREGAAEGAVERAARAAGERAAGALSSLLWKR